MTNDTPEGREIDEYASFALIHYRYISVTWNEKAAGPGRRAEDGSIR
jgi:hypothetical protein